MVNLISATASGLVVAFAILVAQFHSYVPAADRAFTIQAEEAGNMEVAEGRLAEMQGASPTVRALGARMVRDHTRAGNQLMAIARRQGIAVTMSYGASGGRQIRSLQVLHGRAFDDAYVRDNVPDHEKAIALVQHEASAGQDAALRTWSLSTLPTLRIHLSLFQDAMRRMR